MTPSSQEILASPDFYPLRFDGANLVFVQMSRSSYQQSIFTLPNRIVTIGDNFWTVPFVELMELVDRTAPHLEPAAFIFQIAHCGSTLMSRALDQPGASLVIREPFTLRQFAAMPVTSDMADKQARRRALATLCYLLCRRYHEHERVLIKANVPVNFVLGEILKLIPETPAILLFSKFEDYLLGVIKSHKRRMWAMHLVREMAPAIRSVKGFAGIDIESLIPAQATAVLWLTQLSCYQAALDIAPAAYPQGLRSLDSDTLYQQPESTLRAARTHLGIDMSNADIGHSINGELFKHHAKNPGQQYSQQQRLEELARLKMRYQDKIDNTLSWCEKSGFDIGAATAGSLDKKRLV